MDRNSILWVAKSYTLPENGIKPHSHPFCHMLYATKGDVSFTCDGKEFQLKEGQIILVPRDIRHAYRNDADTIFEYLEIKFVPDHALEELLNKTGYLMGEQQVGQQLFAKIVSEYDDNGSASDEVTVTYLAALLNVMTEEVRKSRPRDSRYIDTSSYSALSRRIEGFLEEHLAENFSLDELSENLDYNKTYLCKAFKDDTGKTITDILNEIRIRRAAELITYSDLSLSQVAASCGFVSDSHFNRVFTKYVGITPGQCRRAFPADIMFGPTEKNGKFTDRPGRFMHSVLARKNY